MSGGTFNHQNFYIGSIAEDIRGEVTKYSSAGKDQYGATYEALPRDILDAMLSVVRKLQVLDTAVHDIDWLLAGDYGDESFRESMKEWRDKI